MDCSKEDQGFPQMTLDPQHLHAAQQMLTDVMVHDIFSPPVASRIYAYAGIAAFEAIVPGNPAFRSLAGQLNELPSGPVPKPGNAVCFPIAAVHAYVRTGTRLIFSEEKMDVFLKDLDEKYLKAGVSRMVLKHSADFGQAVADHIIAWADQDNYKQTRTFPKYTVDENPRRWQPTPPAYMDGVEPNWSRIRPFFMDSARQFTPPPPTPFSAEPGSPFFQEAMVVYRLQGDSVSLEEKKAIAAFWDCNPFVSHFSGHVMFATKKISPGGHWIGITGLACKQAKADFDHTAEAYARVGIGLADAFISCWTEKYHSELIRPETYINRYIDSKWMPLLQTPPFPEYTSGHSVASGASAEILTQLFGEPFPYKDTVEEAYGLPPRDFGSFREAAQQAAISRLWGGIHYPPAILSGSEQGRAVGQHMVKNLQTRNL